MENGGISKLTDEIRTEIIFDFDLKNIFKT